MGLRIEVFTAQSMLCAPVVEAVREAACSNCEVTVHDLSVGDGSRESLDKAVQYGITRLPAVVINGELADCCSNQLPITRESLLASVRKLNARAATL